MCYFYWSFLNKPKKSASFLFHLYTICYLFERILSEHELESFSCVTASFGVIGSVIASLRNFAVPGIIRYVY